MAVYDPNPHGAVDFAPTAYTHDAGSPMGVYNPASLNDFGSAPIGGGGYGQPVDSFENEPPLLEELGINFSHIYQKTVAVLIPFKPLNSDLHVNDDDMAGPLFFVLLFGSFLLLSGKVHFGAIYGLGVTGSLALYALMNLMSDGGISVLTTISVLGYCLLPMVILAFLSLALPMIGLLGTVLSIFSVAWCTYSASSMFVIACQLVDQRLLVAYPLALFYACFALFAVF